MRQISQLVPKGFLREADILVKKGFYGSRAELVREGIRDIVNLHKDREGYSEAELRRFKSIEDRLERLEKTNAEILRLVKAIKEKVETPK